MQIYKYIKQILNKTQDSTITEIDFCDFSRFLFKVNHVFMEEKDSSKEKVVMGEEEIYVVEIDI